MLFDHYDRNHVPGSSMEYNQHWTARRPKEYQWHVFGYWEHCSQNSPGFCARCIRVTVGGAIHALPFVLLARLGAAMYRPLAKAALFCQKLTALLANFMLRDSKQTDLA